MTEINYSVEEELRLRELQSCHLLDTPTEPEFDFISKLAAEKCQVKFAAVSLIDKNRQWSKAYFGLNVREVSRELTFCSYAINSPFEIMVVNNAKEDARFDNNPIVHGESNIVFYAGVPLVLGNNGAIGTLCVMHDSPKEISNEQIDFLKSLAAQVVVLIKLRQKEFELSQISEHSDKVFQQLPGAAFRTGLEFPRQWKHVSNKIFELSGYTSDEIFATPNLCLDQLILQEDRKKIKEQILDAFAQKKSWEVTYRIRCKDGSYRWVLERAAASRDSDGNLCLDGLLINFDEQRTLEELLSHADEKTKQNEHLYRSVFSVLSEGLVVQDLSDKIIACNDAASQILDLSHNQLMGKDSYDPLWRATRGDGSTLLPEQHPSMITLRTGRTVSDFLMRVYSGTENYKTISINSRPILDDKGNLTGAVTSFSDITEKINSKIALEESEQKYTELFERMPNGYYRTTHKGQLLDANAAFVNMLGYDSLKELREVDIPSTLYITSNDRDDIQLNAEFNKDMETYRLRKKDGSIIWVEDHARYISDESGEVLFHEGICRDVTDKFRREQLTQLNLQLRSRPDNPADLPHFFDSILLRLLELSESEFGFIGEVFTNQQNNPYLKLQSLTNIAWDETSKAFYTKHSPGNIEFHNLDNLFGYAIKNKELVISNSPKEDPRSGGLPKGHPPLNAFIGIPIKNNNNDILGLIGMANKAGGYAETDVEFLAPFIDSLAILLEHVRSERKRIEAEAELHLRFEQLNATLETTPSVAIQWYDENGKVLYWNHSSELIYGYSKEEALGKTLDQLILDEEENKEFLQTLQEVKQTRMPFGPYEAIARKKNNEICWVWATIFAMPISNGEVAYVCMDVDISDRKKAEEVLREQMAYNESLLAALPDLLFVINRTGTLLEWKAGNTADLYTSPDKFMNRNIYEYLPPDLANEILNCTDLVLNTHQNATLEYELPINGKTGYFDAVISKFGNDKVIFLARNISERKEAQQVLKQSRFRALMAEISSDFIKVGFEQKDAIIHSSLAKCAKFFSADRSVIFELSNDKVGLVPKYQYHSENTIVKEFRLIPAHKLQWLAGFPPNSTTINLGSISDLPESAVGERDQWRMSNTKSAMLVPFKANENYQGLMAITCNENQHHWSVEEEESLRLITNIFTDALSRFQLEENLVFAKTKAEEANKIKTEFLANMSHEIRTPMNAILGFAELLKGKTKEHKYENYLDGILTGGHALMSLIDDILDLSKIEAGALIITETAITLEDLLKEQYSIFSPKAKEKGLFLNYFVEPEIPKSLFLDEIRLKQILFNLIGNAIKFTHSGYVAVSFELLPSKATSTIDLRLSVRDTGIGIPENQFSAIFEPFRQMDGQSARIYGGTGLGLSITKRLANIMGGDLKVESKLGVGSVFTVTIKNIKPAVENFVKVQTVEQIEPVFSKQTILLIEDVESNRLVLKGMLERYDLNIIEAENGLVGLNVLEKTVPDLILLDIMMPVMDGHETAQRIRNHSNAKIAQVPIVVLSATSAHEISTTEITNEFLRKPASKEDLLRVLTKYLRTE